MATTFTHYKTGDVITGTEQGPGDEVVPLSRVESYIGWVPWKAFVGKPLPQVLENRWVVLDEPEATPS